MSKIEWTGKTWNPTTGCTKVSAGCKNCYAETMHARLTRMGQEKYSEPFETVRFHPDSLDVPLRRKKPTTWFVNSMSDLFHKDVTNEQIAAVFGVMAACPQHAFQVLTKRAARLPEWFAWIESRSHSASGPSFDVADFARKETGLDPAVHAPWPLPHVWIGVSVEDQKTADERLPYLRQTPATVRFVSYEPALGPVDFSEWIGYNPVHDSDTERREGLPRGARGLVRDTTERRDLEGASATQEPQGQGHGSPGDTSQNRRRERSGLPQRELHGGRGSDLRAGSQASVAPLQRTDTAGADDQSQKRQQGGQPVIQSGAGDILGTGQARPRGSGQNEPEWGEKQQRETESLRHQRDSSQAVGRGMSEIDRDGLRSQRQDDIKNRPRSEVAIHWIICGGESGPGARPMNIEWARAIVRQCRAAGVAPFCKQLGSRPYETTLDMGHMDGPEVHRPLRLKSKKGGDPSEWPEDLRVREMPA